MKNFQKNKRIYISIAVSIILVCIIICIIIDKRDNDRETYFESNLLEPENNQIQIENNTEKSSMEKIIVHISGEVVSPNIYELDKGSRIADAVEKAGGLTDKADISKVNLAFVLSDGQKVIIPSFGEDDAKSDKVISSQEEGSVVYGGNYVQDKNKININTASQTELECLTGIGPSLASKIIEYRNKNGKFKSVDDLKNVSGIGESKFEGLVDEVEI